VRVRVWVNTDGRASQGDIAQSSGHRRLDEAALNTVLRWRFSPGMVNGSEQAMWVEVPVEFVLK
jgi:protein TonB